MPCFCVADNLPGCCKMSVVFFAVVGRRANDHLSSNCRQGSWSVRIRLKEPATINNANFRMNNTFTRYACQCPALLPSAQVSSFQPEFCFFHQFRVTYFLPGVASLPVFGCFISRLRVARFLPDWFFFQGEPVTILASGGSPVFICIFARGVGSFSGFTGSFPGFAQSWFTLASDYLTSAYRTHIGP